MRGVSECRRGRKPNSLLRYFTRYSVGSEWYFIEVNPPIQVDCTVMEMVTSIDIVCCQNLIAE